MPKTIQSVTTDAPRRRGFLAALAAGAAVTPLAALHAASEGPDDALVRLADQILALEHESQQLCEEEDTLPFGARQRFHESRIRPLSRHSTEMRDTLAVMTATTLSGFRAKARVLQVFNNCAPEYADPWQDDALAWSLANDLLGCHRSGVMTMRRTSHE